MQLKALAQESTTQSWSCPTDLSPQPRWLVLLSERSLASKWLLGKALVGVFGTEQGHTGLETQVGAGDSFMPAC